MIKTKEKDEVIIKKTIISKVCDKCGKEYDSPFEMKEFLHINFIGGYGSIFGDGNSVKCDICQHCLHDMIKHFVREE